MRLATVGLFSLPTALYVEAQETIAAENQEAVDLGVDPMRQVREDLRYLASEELTGRGPGTPGLDLAADYIASAFRDAGLETNRFAGQPFQPFQIKLGVKATSSEENYVQLLRDGEQTARLELATAMQPLSIGASATTRGPLVFAGYGITAPELNYDDYANVSAEDAIVMLIRRTPSGADEPSPFGQRRNAKYAYFATKVQNAIDQGARAVLIINDPEAIRDASRNLQEQRTAEKKRQQRAEASLANAPPEAEQTRQNLRDTIEQSRLQQSELQRQLQQVAAGLLGVEEAGGLNQPAKIPVVSLSRVVADRWLRDSVGQSLTDLEAEIGQTLQPRSSRLDGFEVELQTGLTNAEVTTSNVVGVFPGKGDLANEAIVIGAHYDHIGMGGYGSLAPGTIAVHHGADDNASGTVTLMELARRLPNQNADVRSHRQIIFIAFSGEERGLLGSKHYVQNPLVPLSRTVAMINLDMVGRLVDNELTVYGSGTAVEFETLLDQVNRRAGFDLQRVASGYGPSDHASFYQAGVPVLFFFTGLHNDYHRPSDVFEKIDFGGIARITDITTDVANRLVVSERPTFQSTEPGAGIRRQRDVFLGIRMRATENRIVISEVFPDSSAAKAGLRVDDVLLRLDQQELRSPDDVIDLLRNKRPGQQVKLTLIRNEKQIEFQVSLAGR